MGSDGDRSSSSLKNQVEIFRYIDKNLRNAKLNLCKIFKITNLSCCCKTLQSGGYFDACIKKKVRFKINRQEGGFLVL